MKTKFEVELATWTPETNDKGKTTLEFANVPLTIGLYTGDSIGYVTMKIGDKEFIVQATELIRAAELLGTAIKYNTH